jgi:hypothetical protein
MFTFGVIRGTVDLDVDVPEIYIDPDDGTERLRYVPVRISGYDVQPMGGKLALTTGGFSPEIRALLIGPESDLIQEGRTFAVVQTEERYRLGIVDRWRGSHLEAMLTDEKVGVRAMAEEEEEK